MGPLVNKRHRKRDQSGTEANAPPKVLRTDHASIHPESYTRGGKSLVAMGLGAEFTVPTPIPQETYADVIRPDSLSYARPQSIPKRDIAQSSKGTAAAEDPESEKSTFFTSLAGSPGGYFFELRHLRNPEFLSQNNMTLARQVAIGSQLRLRFEQEVRLRREATAKIARCDQRIQAREEEIKKLDEEVQSLRVVETKIIGEEKIKAAFKEFKKCEDDRVGSWCAKMDVRLDALSIDFDEELYPHMLTAIAGRRWVIGHGLRLAVLKCAESMELRQAFANVVSAGIAKGFCDGLKYGVELGEVKLDLANIKAYNPEAEGKFTATMQALKDLKYPLIDELEKLKDAPMDIIMASLYLESDTREDAPQWIRDLRPSSSQLKIPVYPEVRDPEDPWAFKEEFLLKDAGLCADAASQTELPEDGASPRLVRSKSLPAMYNLDWP
ncbi:hypothetical protein Tco_1064195 [Tanacetum coccineum]